MRGLLQELKRRNVYKVGVAYLVAAFVVIQLADLAAGAFGLPSWFQAMVWLLFLDWRKGAPLRPYLVFNGLWLGNLVMWELAPQMDVWHVLLAWTAGG